MPDPEFEPRGSVRAPTAAHCDKRVLVAACALTLASYLPTSSVAQQKLDEHGTTVGYLANEVSPDTGLSRTEADDVRRSPRLKIFGGTGLARGPYLQKTTSSGVTLRWRTDQPTSTRLLYGHAPGSLTWVEEDPVPKVDHVVALNGLAPSTEYFYAVGDELSIFAGDDPNHYFVTAPLTGTSEATRVWVLGDSGTGDSNAVAVRDAYLAFAGQDPADLWLMLGDNAYDRGTDQDYQSKLFEIYPETLRHATLWPTLGNHDAASSNSSAQSGPYFEIFSLPISGEAGGVASGTEAYYSFDHGNIHFVVLDSHGSDRSLGSPMLVWLELDLAATAQDWIVAYWHHPPYSKGNHDSDNPADSGGRLTEIRENVVPILEDYGVDLVLSGHSHSYERSYLLDGHYGVSGTLSADMLLDEGDGRAGGDGVYWKPLTGPDPHRGTVYTVAGCSGLTSSGALNHPAMYLSLESLGSVVLDFDGDRLDASFIDSEGMVRDTYTMVKGCPGGNGAFDSLGPEEGNESFVFTPGLCDEGTPCSSDIDSSVSSSLEGSFWLLGGGDPDVGAGSDNGTYQPLQPAGTGWVKTDPGGAAYIQGEWTVDQGVDGCIGLESSTECMSVILADQLDAVGYFAALTASGDPAGGYRFGQPAGAPIDLAPIPDPWFSGSTTVNYFTRTVDLRVDAPQQGYYLDAPSCGDELAVGYRIYQRSTGRFDPPPDDRRIASGWVLAEGGELSTGDPFPFGAEATVTLTCFTATNWYLGTALVFESGFELPIVSRTPLYILCNNCLIDDDQDLSCAGWVSGAPGPDCDDSRPTVYPGATQLCGDGVNNDCDHPSWPDLTGTNEFDDDGDGVTECEGDCDDTDAASWKVPGETGALHFLEETWLAWTPPAEPGALIVNYDLLRSAQPDDFVATAACLAADDPALELNDPDTPLSGEVFYYLVRAESACGPGPLGDDSQGVVRAGRSCS